MSITSQNAKYERRCAWQVFLVLTEKFAALYCDTSLSNSAFRLGTAAPAQTERTALTWTCADSTPSPAVCHDGSRIATGQIHLSYPHEGG